MQDVVGYLLDTNILVHLIRGDETGKRVDERFGLRENFLVCAISVVILHGVYGADHISAFSENGG